MKPIAITGLGVVSPLGVGREPFREALGDTEKVAGGALGKPTVLDPEKVGDVRAAEVWGFDAKRYLGDKGLRNFDRLTTFLIVAAKHALEDAGLKVSGEHRGYGAERIGVCSATAYGSLDAITELNLVAELEDPRYINPARFPNTVINAAAGYVSIWEDLRAPNMTVVDGNCGGLDVVLTAATHLDRRRADAFVVGGGEVLSDPLCLAFKMLGAVADPRTGAEGMSLGEGAAYLVAERKADAERRGAKIMGYLTGYGTSFVPPESPALLVSASRDSVERAIRGALEDARVAPDEVDLVTASFSGVRHLDAAEAEGIGRVFGPRTPIAAPKRFFGETFGASGALHMAATLAWMTGVGPVPVLGGDVPTQVKVAVVTTVGFYGNVSAVVLRA